MAKRNDVVRVDIKRAGIARLRVQPGVMADLERRAQLIAEAATRNAEAAGYDRLEFNGLAGFEVDSGKSKGAKGTRGRASVRTATNEAVRAEAHHRSLTAAILAGRG